MKGKNAAGIQVDQALNLATGRKQGTFLRLHSEGLLFAERETVGESWRRTLLYTSWMNLTKVQSAEPK